ncbi:pyruvyl transferase [Microbacterium sp. BK668]|nr:pyruvyl transferase [Microbacterium sp. BK668]
MRGMTINLRGVEVVHWNPRRHLGGSRLARRLPRVVRVNNFGDLIGPLVVRELAKSVHGRGDGRRLLSVGSTLHFARDGDTVWGTGRNGKTPDDAYRFSTLDVRATRGPLTRAWLIERGITAPAVYGDPALLLPTLFPRFAESLSLRSRSVTIVPNLHDAPHWRDSPGFLDPTTRLWACVRAIAESSHVVASSLHGIIIAETFGVPASLLLPGVEDLFKYRDYFEGTGRELPHASRTLAEALDNPAPPLRGWKAEPLLDAFPRDLWSGSSPHVEAARTAPRAV